MMNENELTQKDYELINGYLDQELDRKDVLKFADRMAEDPRIAAEVDELMRVKSMVRELPVVTPPRNYILTRAMAEEARPKPFWERLFPVFRTAAAFCALALMFIIISPLISSSGSQHNFMTMSDPRKVEMAAEEAPSFRDEEIVLEDRDFGGGTDSYQAVMPSYGVRGGNPRIEYMMRMEENRMTQNSVRLDPENPPEGFISVAEAEANQRSLVLKIVFGLGLVSSLCGIYILRRKKQALEVN